MAVGAGSPELKLSVGFDLNYFKGQLTTLGAAASSYHLPINIKFDRLGIQEEFNKLGRNISGRQYNLKVEIKSLGVANEQARSLKENLEALTKIKFAVDTSAIGDAKDALKTLKGEAATAVKNAQSVASKAGAVNGPAIKQRTIRQGLSALSTEDVAAQYKKAAETGIIAYNEAIVKNKAKMITEINTVARAVSDGFISNGSSKFSSKAKADAEAYLRGLKDELEIASPSKRTQRIGEQVSDGYWLGLLRRGVQWERKAAAEIRGQVDRAFKDLTGSVQGKAIGLTVKAQVDIEMAGGALVKWERNLADRASRALGGALVKAGQEGLSNGVSSAIGSVASPGGLATIGAGSVAAGGWESITAAIDLAKNVLSGGAGSSAKTTLVSTAVKVAELVVEHGAEGALVTAAGLAGLGFAGGAAKGFTSSLVTQGITAAAQLTVTQVGVRVVDGLKGVPSVVGNAFKSLPGQVNALALKGRTDIGGLTDGSTYALFKETTGNFVNAAVEQGRLFSEKNAPRIAAALGTGISVGGRAVGRGVAAGGRAVGAGVAAGWENSLEQRISLLNQALAKVNQGIDFLDNVLIKGAIDIQGLTDGTTIAATKQALLGYKATLEIGAAQLMDFHAALRPGNIERVAVSEMVRSQGERVAGQRLLPPIGQSSAGIRRQYRPPNVVPAGGFPTHGAIPVGGFPSDGPAQLSFVQRMFRKAAPPAAAYSNFGYGGFGGGGGTASGGFGGFGGAGGGGPYGGFGYGGFGGGGGGGGGGGNPPNGPTPGAGFARGRQIVTGLRIARESFDANNLPIIGGLKALSSEFANATKQVLLYGTAYRALGFITSLPSQILNAAKSQQQYTNGLKVATQETGTFAKELLFVDNVQRAFGLNLETTRTGFTRLYASMAPTGFDSGSIEKLFTGISAATASLQLTPDKAERVIYAFGQMASKGQIMSEELKGQLGDVLPGALAIFSKAAGMSVKEFSKAMEDGEFVGSRFREVFAKVSDELMNRFGTGAQAAGKSLQGLLNTVGGDFQRTLESFAPLADTVAQAILVPLGGALRQLSTSAQIAMGEIDRVRAQYKTALGDVRDLRAGGASADQIKAAEQNVAALAARYRSLNQALEDPAVAKQVKDIQLFVQELTKAGTFVMNVARAIGGILAPAINFLGTNLTATIATITSFYIGFQTARLAASALMGVLLLYRGLSALMGLSTVASQANALAGAFNILGVSATGAQVRVIGLRVALTALVATTVVGAVVAGIVAIAGAFATMGNRARDAAQGSREAAKAAMDAASTGNVAGAAMNVQTVLAESRKNELARKTLQRIQARATKEQRKGAVGMRLEPEEGAALQGSALTSGMIAAGIEKGGFRHIRALSNKELETRLKEFGSVAGQNLIDLKEAKAALAQAQKVSKLIGQNQPTPGATTLENDATKDKTKAKSLEGYYKLEDDLAKAITEGEIDRANMLFEHKKNLLNTYYDIQDARANSFQKETIKFQREIANIEMDRQKSALDAQNAVKKIEGSVAGGATGLLQGSTGVSSGAHFDVRRQDGKYISPEEARALFDPATAKQLSLTSKYGPRTAPVPGASTFHRGVDLAGPANTPLNLAAGYSMMGAGEKGGLGFTASVRGPQGTMYDVGHLQRPGAGAGAIRPVKGNESRDIKAAAKTEIELQKESLALKYSDELAIQRQTAAMANYLAAMLPIAEQQLQNQILEKRTALQLAGTPQALIDREMELYEAETKNTAAIELHRDKIAELSKQKGADGKLTENAVRLMALEQKALDELIAKFPQYKALLQQAGQLKAKGAFASDMGALNDQLQLAAIIDPRMEQRQKYIQEGLAPGQADEKVRLEEQLAAVTKLRDGYRGLADSIGNSFGQAFKGVISGSMTAREALAGFFQSIADSFLDMVAQMIAAWMRTMLLQGFQSLFGSVLGGMGGGFKFPGTTGLGTNFSSAIGNSTGIPFQFANGGIAPGGFRAFASGGVVTGPTLGLVGEGRYNEAVIPLPDGKSVPVSLRGGSNGSNGPVSVVVNVDAKGSTVEGDEDKANELGRAISAAVQSELIKQQRPGGMLSGPRR